MFKKFIDWYVKTYWGDVYFHKDTIEPLLERARQDEGKLKDAEWKIVLDREQVRMDREKHLFMVELTDQLSRRERELEAAKLKVVKADDLLYAATKGAQGNLHISSLIAAKVSDLRDSLADLSGSILGVEKEARDKLKTLEDLAGL